MRKLFWILCAAVVAIALYNCAADEKQTEDTYTCATCVNSPEADASWDSSHKGIYKGVLVGSTGNFKIDIKNKNNTVKLVVVFDGKTYTIDADNSDPTADAQGDRTYSFSKSGVTLSIKIKPDGGIVGNSATLKIQGHSGSIKISVIKELSSGLVKVYEGSFSGDAAGIWNMILRGDSIKGIYFGSGNNDFGLINGTLKNGVISLTFQSIGGGGNGSASGSTSKDTASGKWTDSSNHKGTWSGKRTR